MEDASEIVFDLIESKRVVEHAKALGPEPMVAVSEWLAVHADNHFGIGLEWQSRRATKRRVDIPFDRIPGLQAMIADTKTETVLLIDGELFGVDMAEKWFKIKADDGTEYRGEFETAITKEHAASVPARYHATILKTTRMVTNKRQKPEDFLRALEPLWPTKS